MAGGRYPEHSFHKEAKIIGKHAISIAVAFASYKVCRLVDVLPNSKRALAKASVSTRENRCPRRSNFCYKQLNRYNESHKLTVIAPLPAWSKR